MFLSMLKFDIQIAGLVYHHHLAGSFGNQLHYGPFGHIRNVPDGRKRLIHSGQR